MAFLLQAVQRGVQHRVLRWPCTRNFIIISYTISGLIVIEEILERRDEASSFMAAELQPFGLLGFPSEPLTRLPLQHHKDGPQENRIIALELSMTALQRKKKRRERPPKGQGEWRGL